MTSFKNTLYRFLFSKLGIILTPLITSGVAIGATKLTGLGVNIETEQQLQIAGWLSAALVTIAQGLLIKKAGDATEKIQEATGAIPDRVAGEETIKKVEQAVVSSPKKLPRNYKPISGPGK